MDMLLIFLITVVNKNNPLKGLYASLVEIIFKLCMVYKSPSCKIPLNFEIIFSRIVTCSEVFYCNIFKSINQIKIKNIN